MNNSAMLQAFQTLKRKPMLFLFLLPMELLSLLNIPFTPDMAKYMDLDNLAGNSTRMMLEMQSMNVLSSLMSILMLLLMLAFVFLLLPPSLELLRDGAAGADTQPGWYVRGLRKHWWKPLVSGLIQFAIYAGLIIALYFVMLVLFTQSFQQFITSGIDQSYNSLPAKETINRLMADIIPVFAGPFGILMLVVYTVKLFIDTMFGLFLPALADRKFGDSFLLVFSKKGFRKFPKMLGGLLLLGIVPVILYAALGAEYWLTNGQPVDFWGIMTLMMKFIKSWEYAGGILIVGVFSVLAYAFRFCIYQEIRAEEAQVQIEQ